ncbi:MAG: trigger factor [Candidatus Magasanikbacteria bacterium RIFCSPHIGHO2_01_FULL_41_23]|uniref:Trigger factor n=1 Tax=Candidatus Magasanikbacteria bacterium RIFCSPLOWO2_01_FULL_40_15 TaxID=1798686 RepID=A0A1F6N3R8_9BACT|nr:MAG: trigger factor [Candidatus Magasanikbacteria bacterium RIFCSPHIGHO2_01_FULL_41_23]OGH76441.1 MAG: trigger factor [Candidatus Magasanikbacteria bacterium RIFCSPHIGHO2_12_FULL_41_16]OGH78398.1 MAG: trigger factor [Candidatus Magasanikbacteria bacterium RIFCSPLOWO2_01_FULL_40_15]
MSHTRKNLPQSQVELQITVTPENYQKHLVKAAEKISEKTKIQGFRPGKAPYEIVKRTVGEMNILQEALETIVQESFYVAVKEENLETIGMPKIEIDKVAPSNDLVYKATVALFPEIKIGDLKKINVKQEAKPVTDIQIDDVIDNLRKIRAKEVAKDKMTEETDMVMIDMDMKLDNVPMEGGQAKNYRVYLSEDHYIPGFNKELFGLKKDDQKTFPISFPKTHYQKHLAGKTVDVSISVKDVYERQLPELNEEFAKALGQDSVERLHELLRGNLTKEAEQKADEQTEIAIFDELIKISKFGEIPEILLDAERKKMYYELTRDLERSGISIGDYLKDIKKTEDQIFNDFKEQAERRAKAAILSRQVAKENNISVEENEIDTEIASLENAYRDNPEYLENLKKPEVRRTLETILQNKKVITWLKQHCLA